MCRRDSLEMSSSSCKEITEGRENHSWVQLTYNLCERARRETPCNDVQEAEGQTYRDRATPRMVPCPVCNLIDEALAEYLRKVEAAKEHWEPRYVSSMGS